MLIIILWRGSGEQSNERFSGFMDRAGKLIYVEKVFSPRINNMAIGRRNVFAYLTRMKKSMLTCMANMVFYTHSELIENFQWCYCRLSNGPSHS